MPIRSILLLAVVSLMGMPYLTLLLIFMVEVFQGNTTILSFLTAASGLGAFSAGIYPHIRNSVSELGKLIV